MKSQVEKAENIFFENIPNFLSISRIVLTFVVAYLIFTNASIIFIVTVFSIAAITDFFDGQLARRFKWESEFGRKTDILADRFLWVGTSLAFIITFGIEGNLKAIHGIQLLLLMSREIVTLPFALTAFFSGKAIPHARFIAKVTTLIQGFGLPAIILSVVYTKWIYLSLPLSIAACITGLMSALYYINDIKKPARKK